MSYRSFEQSTVAVAGQSSTIATAQKQKNVTPGSIFAASQVLRKNRFLLPVGAISAALALGLSAFAKSDRVIRIPYKNPLIIEHSVLKDPELKRIFYCGNTQHLYNSLAIMVSPFTAAKPLLTSALLLSGITIFCGTQYYRSFKQPVENTRPLLLAGGLCFLAGWLTFLL